MPCHNKHYYGNSGKNIDATEGISVMCALLDNELKVMSYCTLSANLL